MTTWGVSVTRPSVEPVLRDTAKAYLRVEDDTDDNVVDALIGAATDYVQNYTGRQLINATCVMQLNEFPDIIQLPHSPLSSVTSVKYYDTDGAQQTLTDGTDYTVVTSREPGLVVPYYNASWPGTRTLDDAVEVTYIAGYGTAHGDVPQGLQTAIKLLIGNWYENREASSPLNLHEVPMAVDSLLWPFKVWFKEL